MAYRDKEGVKLLVNMFNKTKVIESGVGSSAVASALKCLQAKVSTL